MKRHGVAPHLVKEELEDAGFQVLSVEEQFAVRGSSRKALIIAKH